MFPNVHGKEEGMPPKFKFSREEVVKAALDVLRKGGSDSVTARAVGEKLGASSKVIFGLFKNMEELRNEVMKAGYGLYYDYLKEDMEKFTVLPPVDDELFTDYLVLSGGIAREEAMCDWLKNCIRLCKSRSTL